MQTCKWNTGAVEQLTESISRTLYWKNSFLTLGRCI